MIRTVALDRASWSMLVVACVCAIGVGLLVAATSPLLPAAALLAILLLGAIWVRPIVGAAFFVAIVATLPFGVIPIPLAGAQLTLVDAILIATFSAVLARLAFGGWRLPVGAAGTAVIAFVVVAIAAFVAGSASAPLPPELIRRFGKLVASLLFFVVARAILTSADRLAGLTRWLMYAGAVQGAIGAALMSLAPLNQLTLLTRLQVIGYPTADVLRYVPGPNDTYTDRLRAVGTSVDPNVFGGTLMLALALIVVQWASPKPVLPRLTLLLMALPTVAGVLLSLSRASWLGLAAGLVLIGALRYRRILVLSVLAGLVLGATPIGQQFIARFVAGFSTADRATAFRVGEYANALTLLQRYPLLGIGFGVSPDIDVTAGVSSVYLLVAEQTGLLGLAAFVSALAITWWTGLRGITQMRDERLQGIRLAFLAALSGALVAGLLDHYFVNQAFPHAVALFWLYAAGLVAASTTNVAAPTTPGAGPRPAHRQPDRFPHTPRTAFATHRPTAQPYHVRPDR
ncbi:MAG: O-antigen ligase family protein [Chloroflexi bacterium]|nr:O-antigen ligase family protein [Chloroflexota bacterium]